MSRRSYEPETETEEIEDVVALHSTDKAVLVRVEGADYWIPLSQLDPESEVRVKGDTGTLIVARWFARKAGII